MNNKLKPQTFDFDYKGCPKEVLFEKFQTSTSGLSEEEAQKRLAEYGFNEAAKKQKRTLVIQFILKFFHPLVVLLVVIAAVSFLDRGRGQRFYYWSHGLHECCPWFFSGIPCGQGSR